MIDVAVTYAYQNGVTVMAAAGNDAFDRDHDPAWTFMPADSPNAVPISATGPLGWANDPGTSLDVPAYYTNYGQRAIDFAAPGGNIDFGLYLQDPREECTVIVTRPCFAFDMVFSSDINGYSWAVGTSMASPHAAGVAALLIGANGGDMHPAQVKAALMQSADDLGRPGNDDWYGMGRLNAEAAVN